VKRFLICNADDFGASKAITNAIIQAHCNGIITSTTLMANMPAVVYACQKAEELPKLGIGVHLNLTAGKPVLVPDKIPDLLDAEGSFLPARIQGSRLWHNSKIGAQIEKEFSAQIQKVLNLGIRPTHVDSHHHITRFPVSLKAMAKIAREFGITVCRTPYGYYQTACQAPIDDRLRCFALNAKHIVRIGRWAIVHFVLRYVYKFSTPDRKIVRSWFVPAKKDAKENLLTLLTNLPPGITEISFHPGPSDPDPIMDQHEGAAVRERDLVLTTDPDMMDVVVQNNIELISFKQLQNIQNGSNVNR